jgi:hypothetical protein
MRTFKTVAITTFWVLFLLLALAAMTYVPDSPAQDVIYCTNPKTKQTIAIPVGNVCHTMSPA